MIRDLQIKTDAKGRIQNVRIVFGPHHFLELVEDAGKVSLTLGATHHGFKADASEVNGELERIIDDIRRSHPNIAVD